jgi:nicotinamidase/pyrazinamidase
MRTVFIDVDTQADFLFSAGGLYVPGAEEIIPQLASLTRFAASHDLTIVSTVDAHAENDVEFQTWKPHCIAGTLGQQKVPETRLDRPLPLVVSSDPAAFPAVAEVSSAKQIIVEKQRLDCFSNPNLVPLLATLSATRYVVYGVATEYCVQCALNGLIQLGRPIELVTDAIRGIGDEAAEVVDRFAARGVRLVTTADVTS